MLEIYEIWALLFSGVIVFSLVIIMFIFYSYFRYSTGRGRRIAGEVMKDFGIAFLVGGGLKFEINSSIFYVVLIVGALLLFFGVTMKEDKK